MWKGEQQKQVLQVQAFEGGIYDYYDDDDDYGECMPFKKGGCKATLSTLFAQHHRGKLQVIACLGEVEI